MPRRSLDRYRDKRHAGRTPEPFGSRAARPYLYVIQQHAARHLHWDLRLEWNGVLLSWAVPRGPSLDPGEKRLAVHVEDHPLDYADFEGRIPEGNYGAGEVIVWDIGRWTPVEDPDAGLESGKLLFDLAGHKLGGRWTLVRTRRAGAADPGTEWLLIKKPDGFARDSAELSDESVLSGLTLAEMRGGSRRVARIDAALAALAPPPPHRRVAIEQLKPMLAESRERPFSREGWLFEVKYDGFRVLAARAEGKPRLRYRSGRDATALYPELTRSLAALPYDDVVLDGELVALGDDGRPSFQRLQKRAQIGRAVDVAEAAVTQPVVLYVFDVLAWGAHDLRPLELTERRRLLEMLLPEHGPLRLAPSFAERGEEVFAQVERLGLEGMVGKRAASPYRAGRSAAWLKVRIRPTADFAIVGFSAPRGTRAGFGALHLATPHEGRLRYVGRVGSGFRDEDLRALRTRLETLRCQAPACDGPLPTSRGSASGGNVWVEPGLVCEVRYAQITSDGRLRQPVFVRMRDDKTPEDCASALVGETPARSSEPPVPVRGASDPTDGPTTRSRRPDEAPRDVPFTNLDKVFWPEDGTTKGDLIDYHRKIAPWLLPYLSDRPLVLTRYPDGIEGKSFFQKDAPAWAPAWVRTETLWSEQGGREIHYFVCDHLEALLYVINMGAIPLHVWSSRTTLLARPDWCILDLDPKDAPFPHVIRIARTIREVCEEIELPSFVKTSGSTGLHVLLPLAGRLTYEQSRTLAELMARVVVAREPEIATIERAVRARRGRVYVDYLQNGHGRLLVAPLCARPLPGAPVSMPLRWSEVNARLDLHRFHIRNAPRRMQRLGEDPMAPVLSTEPDLIGALARLGERVS